MIGGLAALPDIFLDLLIGGSRRAGPQFRHDESGERILRRDGPRHPDPRGQNPDVLFVLELVRVDEGRGIRVGRGYVEMAARSRPHLGDAYDRKSVVWGTSWAE